MSYGDEDMGMAMLTVTYEMKLPFSTSKSVIRGKAGEAFVEDFDGYRVMSISTNILDMEIEPALFNAKVHAVPVDDDGWKAITSGEGGR